MSLLNFCNICSIKTLEDVKDQLNHLFSGGDCNPVCCAICAVPLPTDGHITDNDDWQGDSQVEMKVEVVTTPTELKRHYVDPNLVTKGLDERVIQLMDPSDDPSKPFKCNLCEISCAKIYNFLRHLKIKHELDFLQEKPYSCEYCDEGFTCFTNLHLHLTSHSTDNNQQFKCEICGANLKTIYSYRRHVKIIHKSERTLPCQYCGKLFRDISEVTGHEKYHQEKRAYPCDLCTMSFTLPSRLKRHRMTHTGERPFRCEICGSSMRDKDYLTKHMRIYHSGASKYSCKKCPFSCTFRKDLTAHNHEAHGAPAGRNRKQPHEVMVRVPNKTDTQHAAGVKVVEEVVHEEEIIMSDVQHMDTPTELPPETIQVISTLLAEADQSKPTLYHNDQPKQTADDDAAAEVLYHCVDCGFKSSDGLAMRTHMNSHLQEENVTFEDVEDNEAVSYRCEDCGFTSANAVELYEHVLTSHQDATQDKDNKAGEGSEKCEICNETFRDVTSLRIHQASHISVQMTADAPKPSQHKKVTSPIKIQASLSPPQPNNSSRFSELVDAAGACEPVKIIITSGASTSGVKKDVPATSSKKIKVSETAQKFNIGNEEIVGKVTPAHIKRYKEARQSKVPMDQSGQQRKRAASESNGQVDEGTPSKVERTATRSVTRNKIESVKADFKRMTYM